MEIKAKNGNLTLYKSETAETIGQTVEEAVRKHVDLYDANLKGINLVHANLEGAQLVVANLSGANLCCANLSGADLCCADLEGAYLWGANFEGANISRARIYGAKFHGARLSGAKLCGGFIYPKDKPAPLMIAGSCHPVTVWPGYIEIGCEFHPIPWWSENVEKCARELGYTVEEAKEYRIIVNMCIAWAELYGMTEPCKPEAEMSFL